jgi:hypothetical protein
VSFSAASRSGHSGETSADYENVDIDDVASLVVASLEMGLLAYP